MFGRKKGRFVQPPPVVPLDSATAEVCANLRAVLEGSCPAWRDAVRRYVTERPAEGTYTRYDLEYGFSEEVASSQQYPKADWHNFVASVEANPVALFRLIVETGAGVREVSADGVVEALGAIADRFPPPANDISTPAATWVFGFPGRADDAVPDLVWGSGGRDAAGVASLLASVVGQDLSGAGGPVLAGARRDVVAPVSRIAVLFAARTVIARSPESLVEPGIAVLLAEQAGHVEELLGQELAGLSHRVEQYRELQSDHVRALAGIDADYQVAVASEDAVQVVGAVDAVLRQEGWRPVRSSVRGVRDRRAPSDGFEV